MRGADTSSWPTLLLGIAAVAVPATVLAASAFAQRKARRHGRDEVRSWFDAVFWIESHETDSSGLPDGASSAQSRAAATADGEHRREATMSDSDAAVAGSSVITDDGATTDGLEDDTEDEKLKKVEGEEEEGEVQASENLAPLHLHAMRIPARLRGSSYDRLAGGDRPRSRSSSLTRGRSSRSASPLPKAAAVSESSVSSEQSPGLAMDTSGPKTGDTGSSASSLAGDISTNVRGDSSYASSDIDPDILLDKMGFEELEPPPPHEIAMGTLASPHTGTLPPVNERLSEETLDDCHAFSDLVAVKLHSREGSVAGGSLAGDASTLLETLDECDLEDDSEGDNSSDDADDEKEDDAKEDNKDLTLDASNLVAAGSTIDKTKEELEELERMRRKKILKARQQKEKEKQKQKQQQGSPTSSPPKASGKPPTAPPPATAQAQAGESAEAR